MKSLRNSMKRICTIFSRPISFSEDPNRLSVDKNKYIYDPELKALVPIESEFSESDEDKDEKNQQKPKRVSLVKPYLPNIPMVAANGVRVDTISPEFGRMYNMPLVAPAHSFIQAADKNSNRVIMANSVITNRKRGSLIKDPEAHEYPATRRFSDPQGAMKVAENYRRVKSIETVPVQDEITEILMISEGTQVTDSLTKVEPIAIGFVKTKKLIPLHATISEPIDYYAHKSQGVVVDIKPETPVKLHSRMSVEDHEISAPVISRVASKKPSPTDICGADDDEATNKKCIKWGAWSLLEFMNASTTSLTKSHSTPNAAIENLAKCAGKSILRDSRENETQRPDTSNSL